MSRVDSPRCAQPGRREFLRVLSLPAVATALACTASQDVPGPSAREVPSPPADVPMAPRPSPALAVLRAYRLDHVELATVFRAAADE
jgi:hypothetical protein